MGNPFNYFQLLFLMTSSFTLHFFFQSLKHFQILDVDGVFHTGRENLFSIFMRSKKFECSKNQMHQIFRRMAWMGAQLWKGSTFFNQLFAKKLCWTQIKLDVLLSGWIDLLSQQSVWRLCYKIHGLSDVCCRIHKRADAYMIAQINVQLIVERTEEMLSIQLD